MNPSLIALNRFGLGARPGEPARIGEPKAWLTKQLQGPAPELGDASLPTNDALGAAIRALRQAQNAKDPGARMEARRRVMELTQAEMRATLHARLTSDRPFAERLVAFWSNHFCVSAATKAQVAPLASVRQG